MTPRRLTRALESSVLVLFTVLTWIALSSAGAKADILFLNFNHSPNEYRAAKTAADKLGEKLIAFPPLDEAALIRFREKEEELDRLNKRYSALHQDLTDRYGRFNIPSEVGKEAQVRDPSRHAEFMRLSELQTAANRAYVERDAISRSWGDEELGAFLKKQQDLGVRVTTLIVSGHNGNDVYYGSSYRNEVSRDTIMTLGSRYRELFKDARSIVMMTCYGGTMASVRELRKGLPQASVVGFDSQAPIECAPLSAEILYQSLMRRETMGALRTGGEALGFLKEMDRLTGFRKTCSVTIAANDFYVSGNQVWTTGAESCRPQNVEKTRKKLAEAKKYFYAEEAGYEDLPRDPNRSVIREAKSLLEMSAHCPALQGEEVWLPRLLALIHFDDVRKNFASTYESMVRLWNTREAFSGQRPLPDFSSDHLTRKQILSEVQRMVSRSAAKDKLRGSLASVVPLTEEERSERKLVAGMQAILGNLDLPGADWMAEGAFLSVP